MPNLPHAALTRSGLTVLVLGIAWNSGFGQNPHLDPALVEGGCSSCHAGHGSSRSPMLPGPQAEICLGCHGSEAAASDQARLGNLAAEAKPQLLGETLAHPYTHPLTQGAFSKRENGSVTCSSCHSPHRGKAATRSDAASQGRRKLSPLNPTEFEFELCQDCHGGQGVKTANLLDVSRLTAANNSSYHPIEAQTDSVSPSVLPSLTGKEINCTDCHGNNRQDGPVGPHGSEVPYLLVSEYITTDGGEESKERYALCYDCHRRPAVLDSPLFPLHRMHVVEENASCATCHNAHGSVENRALIRFGEETIIGGLGPSAATGRLGFFSDSPGAGTCFLTCHGVDHAPMTYGGGVPDPEVLEVRDDDWLYSWPEAAGPPGLDAPRPPRKEKPDRRRQ